MENEIQISALISEATKEAMEAYARATGVKKGHLIEQALLHHLQALDEIPPEYIVHPRLVVSGEAWESVIQPDAPAKPAPALRKLIRDGD